MWITIERSRTLVGAYADKQGYKLTKDPNGINNLTCIKNNTFIDVKTLEIWECK